MKLNFIYIYLFIGTIALVYISKKYISGGNEFFGVAENLNREINLEYPAQIKKLAVTLSQNVKKGDLLAVVYRTDLPMKFNMIDYSIQELNSKNSFEIQLLKGEIGKIEAEKKVLTTAYNEKIKQFELEGNIQKTLMNTIIVLDVKKGENEFLKQKILGAQNQFQEELKLNETKLMNFQNELKKMSKPIEAQIRKLEGERELLKKQEADLNIYAPQDGIISELVVQNEQKIDAYKVLMKIYDVRPNIVTTYITESNVTSLVPKKEYTIMSIHNKNYQIQGKLIGQSTRITLIPERLRKVPEMKLWGREIQLQISSDNNFLQGEKVKVVLR